MHPGKRILILTNHFYPENFRANDVAFDLVEKDFDVTVLTCIPNYPQGRFYKGYGLFKKRKEIVRGVKIIRVPLIPRGKGSLFMLSLNYISYNFFLLIWSFFTALFNKFDSILVHHTSPVFVGIPAVMVKKMQKIKLYFWNLDIWPESMTETTGLKLTLLVKIIDKIVRLIYRNSDKILISSKAFKPSLLSRGTDEKNIIYFPNWAEDLFLQKEIEKTDLNEYGVDQYSLKIMFAGNIGAAQDLENVINAIDLTSRSGSNITWLFVGDGRKLEWMKNTVKEKNLAEKVFFLGQHPVERMPSFFNAADVMLVSLKNEYIFSLTAPAKIQTYMASSKPILAMISGEGAGIIKESGCGLVSNAGDYESLYQNAIRFAKMSIPEREELGRNGYNSYINEFAKEKTLAKLQTIIHPCGDK